MYFVNRIDLGRTMAQKLAHLKAQNAIVLCLREESLSTSIGLAAELHAWIYPLLTEAIIIPGDPRILGVIGLNGELCYNPALSSFEREEIESDNMSVIQDASRDAFSRLNQQSDTYGALSADNLQGRAIILCADILRDQIQIAAAMEILKPIMTQSVIGIAGNILSDAADLMTLSSEKSNYMDVMTNMFDDAHYFEQPETYTIDERRQLAMNISQYWA